MPTGTETEAEREFRLSRRSFERGYELTLDWMPYATLTLSLALYLAVSGDSSTDTLTTVAIAAAAALWVYLAYTRIESFEEVSQTRLVVHFLVMLSFAAVLITRDMTFFVFVITAYFHADLLKSAPLMVTGIAAASIVLNSGRVGEGFDAENVALFITVVVVQTVAISSGFLLGGRFLELAEERQEALLAKEAALEENAGLHMQLLTQAREAGVLDERQRLARDIHDTVAQGLAGIIAQLNAADGADDADRRRHLRAAADLAHSSLDEARRTVRAVGPPTLDAAQLPEALAEETAKWSEANGVRVEFTTTGEAKPMHPEIEVTLLRTAQEALANVRKHAGASRVGLTLSYMDDQVALDARDDGRGFDPHSVKPRIGHGYGLAAMRQRVNHIGGSVSIESEPGAGTVISANVPAIPQAVADAR